MLYYGLKVLLSALVIVVVSEVAKRSSVMAALIASLPLTSLLAITWLYLETSSLEKVAQLSMGIFWLIVPSFVFFLTFPLLVKWGLSFWPSLGGAVAATAVGYLGYVRVMARFDITL